MSELPSFDWNLMRNFEALLLEKNVTRAAARVGMTQSAMSRALSRLRVVFDDELFVRARAGLEPTARALALSSEVHELCDRMSELVLSTGGFDPATAQRTFHVISADFAEWLIMPDLLKVLQREAPGLVVVFRRANMSALAHLEQQETDLVIGPERREAASMSGELLFDEGFCCIARDDHPRLGGKRRLSLEAFCREAHVLIAPRGQAGGAVDQALAKVGRSRHVAARVSTFLVAPQIVGRTELIATVPRRIAEAWKEKYHLKIMTPPIEVDGFSMMQTWHVRNDRDPAHLYLRERIVGLFR